MVDIAILLVDNQDAGLAKLAALLRLHGYRTRRVGHATDAVAALKNHASSLVFIDLRHPQATQICRSVRDTVVGAVTPIIMMGSPGTAIASVADALSIGADFYFNGPWRDEAVLDKVRTYVGESAAPVVYSAAPEPGDTRLLARLGRAREAAFSDAEAADPDDLDDLDDPGDFADADGSDAARPGAAARPERAPEARQAPEKNAAPPAAPRRARSAGMLGKPASARRKTPASVAGAPGTGADQTATSVTRAPHTPKRSASVAGSPDPAPGAAQATVAASPTPVRGSAPVSVAGSPSTPAGRMPASVAGSPMSAKGRKLASIAASLAASGGRKLASIAAAAASNDNQPVSAPAQPAPRSAPAAASPRAAPALSPTHATAAPPPSRPTSAEARSAPPLPPAKPVSPRAAPSQSPPPSPASGVGLASPPSARSPDVPPSSPAIPPAAAAMSASLRAARSRPAASLPAEAGTDLTTLTRSPPPLPPPDKRRKAGRPEPALAPEAVFRNASPGSGRLDETAHVALVLAQAWTAQATGRMDWHQGDVHVCLWFHEGSPCGYSSNLAHDQLGPFLLRTGSIRHAACRQLELQNLSNPRLTLAYLVRLQEIGPERLWPLLTAHLAEQTYGLFAWESGAFSWHGDAMPLEERITLGVPTPAWLMEGLRRKYDLPRLVAQLGGPATMVAMEHTPAPALGLHLGEAEARVMSLFDGHRTLEDVAGNCGVRIEEVYRVALLLLMLRHARLVMRSAARPGAQAGQNPVRDAQRITEKLQQTRLADYFEILGITVDAGSHEVELAACRMAEAFHPGSFNHDLRVEYEVELAEIAEIVADAREVLMDSGKREAYAQHMI